jgi:hypothetical protein
MSGSLHLVRSSHDKVLVAGCLSAFLKLVKISLLCDLLGGLSRNIRPINEADIGISGSTRLITDKRRPELPSGDMPIYPSKYQLAIKELGLSGSQRPWR